MLVIKNLTKIYKAKKGVNVYALDNISLTFPKTGMVFILGKSGSGKSTLLNILGGLDSFDSGNFYIKGESTARFRQSHYDSYRNTYIGFIFQDYNILDDFSVGANIGLAMELQGKKANNEVIDRILREVDLDGLGNRMPNELSGGQKQRVAIARALIKEPNIIMADEPTGALDSTTGKQIFETLKKLSKTKLVLVVSHDREFAEGYADRIIELKDGKVISDVTRVNNSLNDSIEFDGASINIKEGYSLSVEDLKKINDYMAANKISANINIKKKEVSNDDDKAPIFTETNSSFIMTDDGGFRLIKSSLSARNSFKIGCSSLKHKVGRLIFTILLSTIAFSFFGLTDIIASYSRKNTAITSFIDNNLSYSSLVKQQYIKETDEDYEIIKMEKSDIDYINKELDAVYKGVYIHDSLNLDIGSNFGTIKTNSENRGYYEHFKFYFEKDQLTGIVELTGDDLNRFDFKMLGGYLPKTFNEIAISDYLYNVLKITGYSNKEKTESIKSVDDLIGRSFEVGSNSYKITGIIDMNFDFDIYINELHTMVSENLNDSDMLTGELQYSQMYSLINTMIVKEGFIEQDYKETGTRFVSPTKSRIFLSDNSFNYVTLGALCSSSNFDGKIEYFGTNKTIDENHIVVTPTTLKSYAKVDSLTLSDSIKNSLDKIIVINGKMYSSYELAEEGSLFDGSNLIFNNEIYKFVMNLYETNNNKYKEMVNKYEDFEGVFEHFRSLANYSNENYDAYNREERNLVDSYLAKNLYIAYKKCGVDFAKNISLQIEDSNSFEKKEIDVEIIGVCYDTNFRKSSECIILEDSMFDGLVTSSSGMYAFAISNMPSTNKEISKIYDFTIEKVKQNNKFTSYELKNDIIFQLDLFDSVLKILQKYFLYIALVFAVFATLLLSNFITTSITFKKKDIGILRAIGSRGKDVFKIFFAESFIIALINFMLSVASTIGLSILLNNIIKKETGTVITAIIFQPRQVVLILIICFLIACIGTFLPVNKVARKRPVEAIRNIN